MKTMRIQRSRRSGHKSLLRVLSSPVFLVALTVLFACDGSPAQGSPAAPVSEPGRARAHLPVPGSVSDVRVGSSGSSERSAREDSAGESVLASSSLGSPFGRSDYVRALPVVRDGSLFSLGADDLPGPFWDEPLPLPSQAGGPSGQVFDVCDIRGAYVIWYGFEPSVNALAEFQSDWGRLSADCRMEREPDGLFARYALVVDYVSSPLFETKDEAFAWGRQYARELRVEQWDSLPFGIEARGITGYSTHHPFIQFAPADTPVGRVEVVAGSVDQRDGVIRGLIRNRSRRQFAYDVRVTYRGESWSWPLAMQPGELAAFELKHAETDTTLQVDQIVVKARLSAEADLSRNVNFNCGHGPFEANAQTVPIMLPEEIRSALPSNGRHTIQSDCGRMGLRTTSHPGLPHYADGVSVDVLAAFVAFLDQERVVEVLRVPVAATYMHNNEQGDEIWASRVITSLPLQHPHLRGFEYPELTVTVAAPPSEGPDPYQYLVWIGRAHE